MLRRRLLSLMILNSYVSPIRSSMFGTRRSAICEPGRKASTPIRSTVTPPLILRVSTPCTGVAGLVRLADLLPDAEEVGLLLGQDDDAVLVLEVLEEDLDLVADLERVGVLELVAGDRALALEAEVEDDRLVGDAEDPGLDDLTLFDVAEGGLVHVEHRLVLLGRVLVLVVEVGADPQGVRALLDLCDGQLAPQAAGLLRHGDGAFVLGGRVLLGLGLVGHGVGCLLNSSARRVRGRRWMGVNGCRTL
jgi:hypothetical protein